MNERLVILVFSRDDTQRRALTLDPCLDEITRAEVLLVLHLSAEVPARRAAYGISQFLLEDSERGMRKRPSVARMLARLSRDGYIEPDAADVIDNSRGRRAFRLKDRGVLVAEKYAQRVRRLSLPVTTVPVNNSTVNN